MIVIYCDGCGEKVDDRRRGDWKAGVLPRDFSVGMIVPLPAVVDQKPARELLPVGVRVELLVRI